jgi:hypothetical protein
MQGNHAIAPGELMFARLLSAAGIASEEAPDLALAGTMKMKMTKPLIFELPLES